MLARLAACAVDPDTSDVFDIVFEMSYDPADPCTVSLAFSDDVVWHLSRDLVDDGTRRRTGDGDVCVSPNGSRRVVIGLTSPEGAVLLEVDREPLVAFLGRTFEAVPRGLERVDVDTVIEQILIGR